MSVERSLFFVLVCFLLFRLRAEPLNYLIFVILILFLTSKVKARFVIMFVMMVMTTSDVDLPSESDHHCGKIIDIKDKVTIISVGKSEYSMFDTQRLSLDDIVCVSGSVTLTRNGSTFVTNPILRWSNQRNHRGSINVKSIEIIKKGNSVKSQLFERIGKLESSGWLKAFIFHHPPPKTGHFTMLFLSSGLIASSLVSMIRTMLGYLCTEKHKQRVLSVLLIFCLFIWGSSFILSRILLSDASRYLKLKPLGRISFTYILLLCCYPHHLSHPALIIPLTLSLINVFNYDRFLSRMAILPLILTFLTYRFDFLSALLFPVFRMLALFGYLFAWTCVLLPQLLSVFISYCEMLSFQSHDFISFATLSGYPGIILSVGWIIALFSIRLSKKQLILRLVGLLVIFQLRLYVNPFTTVTFFNVAQADSALIELPYKQGSWLIDTGRSSTSALLRANLWYRGITVLDAVMISHDDSDHSGGLEMLKRDFLIREVIDEAIDVRQHGFTLYSLLEKKEGFSDNDNSLVHLFSINGLTYLFLGDISKNREIELIRKYPFLRADIIKLAHHGSKTSTSEQLIANTQPKLSIISADPRVYGHPHKQTLKTLWQFRVPYLSTHQAGDIRISTLGNFHFVMSSSGGFGIMRTVIK
jgi:competence protein ComEC